jgi:hypothetical protein
MCLPAEECSCRCSNIFAHRNGYNPRFNDQYDAQILPQEPAVGAV